MKEFIKKIIGIKKFPYLYKEYKHGVKFVINNSIEEYRIRFWGGEREFVNYMISSLDPQDIFFDIGSSIGLFSVLAAKKLTKGKVMSFEPDPENIDSLQKNYHINNLCNFKIHPIAVGEKQETLRLYTAGSNAYSPSLRQVNGILTHLDVEVRSIDDLLDEKKVPLPNVIKIDVEGAEAMVLNGMRKLLLSSDRPKFIFLEVHPSFLPSFDSSELEIRNFLSSIPYNIVNEEARDGQILIQLERN
jgi:FkbM family methyltransferase